MWDREAQSPVFAGLKVTRSKGSSLKLLATPAPHVAVRDRRRNRAAVIAAAVVTVSLELFTEPLAVCAPRLPVGGPTAVH
jgi:hypothetical protein